MSGKNLFIRYSPIGSLLDCQRVLIGLNYETEMKPALTR
jgi:hypothetical protein